MPTRSINQLEVYKLLPMKDCVALMAEALKAASSGEAVFPLRRGLRVPGKHALLALMPGIHTGIEAMGAKVISIFPDNHGTTFDSHQGMVLLFDTNHGYPQAIIDGIAMTEIRTAAVCKQNHISKPCLPCVIFNTLEFGAANGEMRKSLSNRSQAPQTSNFGFVARCKKLFLMPI